MPLATFTYAREAGYENCPLKKRPFRFVYNDDDPGKFYDIRRDLTKFVRIVFSLKKACDIRRVKNLFMS
jgi:hypothetical protein